MMGMWYASKDVAVASAAGELAVEYPIPLKTADGSA